MCTHSHAITEHLVVLIVLIIIIREEFPGRVRNLHPIKHTGGNSRVELTEQTMMLHVICTTAEIPWYLANVAD